MLKRVNKISNACLPSFTFVILRSVTLKIFIEPHGIFLLPIFNYVSIIFLHHKIFNNCFISSLIFFYNIKIKSSSIINLRSELFEDFSSLRWEIMSPHYTIAIQTIGNFFFKFSLPILSISSYKTFYPNLYIFPYLRERI